eukprot:6464521-Amphidinium_carterae.1
MDKNLACQQSVQHLSVAAGLGTTPNLWFLFSNAMEFLQYSKKYPNHAIRPSPHVSPAKQLVLVSKTFGGVCQKTRAQSTFFLDSSPA